MYPFYLPSSHCQPLTVAVNSRILNNYNSITTCNSETDFIFSSNRYRFVKFSNPPPLSSSFFLANLIIFKGNDLFFLFRSIKIILRELRSVLKFKKKKNTWRNRAFPVLLEQSNDPSESFYSI